MCHPVYAWPLMSFLSCVPSSYRSLPAALVGLAVVAEVVVAVGDVARAAPLGPREDEQAAHRVLVLRPTRRVRGGNLVLLGGCGVLLQRPVDPRPNAGVVIIVALPKPFIGSASLQECFYQNGVNLCTHQISFNNLFCSQGINFIQYNPYRTRPSVPRSKDVLAELSWARIIRFVL